MKKILLLITGLALLLGLVPQSYAQNQFECMMPPGNSPPAGGANQKSYYGGVHTPKGHLHMLVVFVQYTDNYLSTQLYPTNGMTPLITICPSLLLFFKNNIPIFFVLSKNIP